MSDWNKRHRVKRERAFKAAFRKEERERIIKTQALEPFIEHPIRPEINRIRVAFHSPYFTEEYLKNPDDIERLIKARMLQEIARRIEDFVDVRRTDQLDYSDYPPSPIWVADVLVAKVPEEVKE